LNHIPNPSANQVMGYKLSKAWCGVGKYMVLTMGLIGPTNGWIWR